MPHMQLLRSFYLIPAEGALRHWNEAQGWVHDAKASKTVHRQVLARSGGPHCEGSSGCECGIDALCPGFSPFVINPVNHEQDPCVCSFSAGPCATRLYYGLRHGQ